MLSATAKALLECANTTYAMSCSFTPWQNYGKVRYLVTYGIENSVRMSGRSKLLGER